MENKIKCFSKKHEENEAVIYDPILNTLDKDISNVFIGICKEPNHNCELEYFCHTHNILCC